MADTYTTPPHLRPRELWRLDIHGEGIVVCFYLPIEKAIAIHRDGSLRNISQYAAEEDALKAAEMWRQGYGLGVMLSGSPEVAH